MGWSCRRPGCNREAIVSITYDAVARQVWLDQIVRAHPSGQPLCDDHAQRLSAPRGWVVLDRRGDEVAAPAVEPTEIPAAVAPNSGPRFPRRWGQIEEARAEFVAPVEVSPTLSEPDFRAEDDDGHTGAPLDPPTLEHGAAEQSDGLFDDDPDTMAKSKKKPDDPKRKKEQARNKAKGKGKSPGKKDKKSAVEPEEPVGDPLAPVASRPEPPPTRARRPARHDTLLQPKGRLLSRAFDAGGAQRSAITVRGDDEGSDDEGSDLVESPDSDD